MSLDLNPIQLRVLGCLVEKDLSTPEYYPLSLNALVNACNQKSNRDPFLALDAPLVYSALDALRDAGLTVFVTEAGSRVEKYRHRLTERFNFTRPEFAILAELMLRGHQSPGELRTRCERMYHFDDPDTVEHTLRKLASREPDPLVLQLPLQPGKKDQRWAHLLGNEVPTEPQPRAHTPFAVSVAVPSPDRMAQLESDVAALKDEVAELKRLLDDLTR